MNTPQLAMDPTAEAMMRHAIGGAIRTQAIYVAAKLGIADRLTLGPQSAAELARQVRAETQPLQRLLRFLVAHGVFCESADGRFALNAPAQFLQSAHPRSLRLSAIRAGEGLFDVSRGLLDAVQSGVTPQQQVHGAAFFEELALGGAEREFAARMSRSATGLGAAIAERVDLAQANTIVDVGGGSGAVLLPILQRHPHLQGIVFDTAISAAEENITNTASSSRCKAVVGSFFAPEIPQGDVYLLSWVLHDWDDASACQILRNCRAANVGARLLIIEILRPPHAQALQVPVTALLTDPFTLDLQMLLLTGGRERSLPEYRTLLAAAGASITSTCSLPSSRGVSLIVAGFDRS